MTTKMKWILPMAAAGVALVAAGGLFAYNKRRKARI